MWKRTVPCEGGGGSKTPFWEFPNLVVLNLVVRNFYAEALFCAFCVFSSFLRPFANSLFCAHLRAFVGPATTQNLVVKLDGEICSGVLAENASDNFPQQKKLESLLPKLRQKFATNFAESFANFTLEIAGAYICVFLQTTALERPRLRTPDPFLGPKGPCRTKNTTPW